jgi:hypothetical protein
MSTLLEVFESNAALYRTPENPGLTKGHGEWLTREIPPFKQKAIEVDVGTSFF